MFFNCKDIFVNLSRKIQVDIQDNCKWVEAQLPFNISFCFWGWKLLRAITWLQQSGKIDAKRYEMPKGNSSLSITWIKSLPLAETQIEINTARWHCHRALNWWIMNARTNNYTPLEQNKTKICYLHKKVMNFRQLVTIFHALF